MSGQQVSGGPANAMLERLPGWLPGWLGSSLGFVAFGVAAIASSGLAWWSGAKSEPRANPFDRRFITIVT